MASINTGFFLFQVPSFHPDFVSAADAAARQAAGHFDFACPPVYFGVVFSQPGDSEDQVLSSETSYRKQCSFRMFLVPDDELDYFRYAASFVWSSIYVEDWDHPREFFCRKSV